MNEFLTAVESLKWVLGFLVFLAVLAIAAEKGKWFE